MPNMTLSEFLLYEARQKANKQATPAQGCDKEGTLHDEILAECRRRGWLAIHSRMDRKTTTASGVFDFIILGVWGSDEGTCSPQVWFIEVKTRTGKLSPAQRALHAHAKKLGHAAHIVRSFAEFMKAVG